MAQPPESESQLELTAVHEASHGVLSVLLGFTDPGPITIERCGPADGRAWCGEPPWFPESERGALGGPIPLLPELIRRHHEADAMVALGGEVAERVWLLGRMEPGKAVRGMPPRVAEIADEVSREVPGQDRAPMPDREAALLAEAPGGLHKDDYAGALQLARKMTGGGDARVARCWLALMEAEAESMLTDPRAGNWPVVMTLAGELLEHRTLHSAEWLAIVKAAGCASRLRSGIVPTL